MRLSIFSIASLLIVPLLLHAQETHTNVEITLHSGYSFLDADERVQSPCTLCLSPLPLLFVSQEAMGGSFLFGVKAGYYLNPRMEIEGSFAVAPNRSLTETNDFFCPPGEICPLTSEPPYVTPSYFFPSYFNEVNVVSYQYDANFVYNFTESSARPFATFGVGAVTTDMLYENKTDFVFNFGGGAKFYFKHLGIRVEVNDHVMPEHFLTGKTEHDLQVQYGFVFRLP